MAPVPLTVITPSENVTVQSPLVHGCAQAPVAAVISSTSRSNSLVFFIIKLF